MKIILDDARTFKPVYYDGDTVFCRNANEFVKVLDKRAEDVEVIWFDHDLGDYSMDGLWCAKIMNRYYRTRLKNLQVVRIHSTNPVGAENILNHLGAPFADRATVFKSPAQAEELETGLEFLVPDFQETLRKEVDQEIRSYIYARDIVDWNEYGSPRCPLCCDRSLAGLSMAAIQENWLKFREEYKATWAHELDEDVRDELGCYEGNSAFQWWQW